MSIAKNLLNRMDKLNENKISEKKLNERNAQEAVEYYVRCVQDLCEQMLRKEEFNSDLVRGYARMLRDYADVIEREYNKRS